MGKQPTPHEMGYRAYQQFGLAARNPFSDTRQERSADAWARGFAKAREEDRK